jgi:hypothetical protein
MRAIALSFSSFCNARLSRLAAGHRDADLIEKISQDMLQQLLRQGTTRAFCIYALIVPIIYFWDRALAPLLIRDYGPMNESHYFFGGAALLIAYLLTWKKTALASVEREIRYYRLNRKWRWER